MDSQEKIPWDFYTDQCIGNISVCKLPTGDYTIEGLEDVLCIERKKSVAELAKNVTEERFERELERMSDFAHKFLILEFGYNHIESYPVGSGIPKNKQKRVKVKGPFIMSVLARIQTKYDIHVIPCGHRAYAEQVAYNIMKAIYKKYHG